MPLKAYISEPCPKKDTVPHAHSPYQYQIMGTYISYEGEEGRHILFANEAAYYEKHFSMCLTDKKKITLPR